MNPTQRSFSMKYNNTTYNKQQIQHDDDDDDDDVCFFIFVVLLLTSFVFSLGFKRLTSSSCSYCLVLEFAHKSGYGVIMHFYKLFRVLTLFSENCSYNTLRFIFIILLPVKAAWSHDYDDDDDDDDDDEVP